MWPRVLELVDLLEYCLLQNSNTMGQGCGRDGAWMGHGWGRDGAGMWQGWGTDGAWMGQGCGRDGAGMGHGWGMDGAGMGQGWGRDGAWMRAWMREIRSFHALILSAAHGEIIREMQKHSIT